MLLKIVLFLFALIVAYGIYATIRFRSLVKKGASIASNTIPFQRPLPGATERILVTGDSSAVGTGARRPEESTAGRLAADHPKAEVVNISRNGLRAAELLPLLESKGKIGHFDIAVVQIGGNDINYGTDLPEIEKSVRGVLSFLREHADKIVLMHSSNQGDSPIFPRIVGIYITHRTRLLRDMYMRIAPEYGARYADLFSERADDIWLTDIHRYYAADLFHPGSDGYELWYEAIKKALKQKI